MTSKSRKSPTSVLGRIQEIARRTIDANYRSFLGDEFVDAFIEGGDSDRYLAKHLNGCLVLADDDRIVAFAVCKANIIDFLLVDHEMHGRGFGTQLLTQCEEQLFAGHDELRLACFEGNHKAITLYEECGWVAGDHVLDEDTGATKVWFTKRRPTPSGNG